jgi:glucosamine-6-phosphate deaminase
MKKLRVASREAGSELAAELFTAAANANPESPVGLATGATMQGVYSALANLRFQPSCEHAFALDEYLDIDPNDQNSYHNELTQAFCEQLDWGGRLHVPGQFEYEGEAGYQLFEQRHAELGPVSVQLLGLGANGHIAFNEPGSSFDSLTREVELAEQTIRDNSRFFESLEQTPTRAVTQGIATIMRAESILLLVFGETKRAAALSMLGGDPATPASALASHPAVTIITDLDL